MTLTLPTAEDAECEPVWQENDWGRLARSTAETESGAAGEFWFDEPPEELAHGAVLWASHPAFRAAALVLPPDRRSWPAPIEIELEPARPMFVSVLDAVGVPVSGALVEHHGLAEPLQNNTTAAIGPERAQRLFSRTYTSGPDGAVSAVAFPGTQVLVARRGSEATVPWRGTWRERVTLRLCPTFGLEGAVSLPEFPDDPTRERRIVVAAQTRNLWRDLASIRGIVEGAWGPLSIPLVGAERYRLRLEGPPIVPVEVFLSPPSPGARMTLNLAAELGDELWFKVVDERGTVIPTARVKARWKDPDQPDQWHFAEASKTREDQIGIVSVPRGAFEYDAWAPGFLPVTFGPMDTSICETSHLRTELHRAGTLHGKVRHRLEPVEDFEVIVWQPTIEDTTRSTSFVGRVDGTFELDCVPVGEFMVTATSSFTPACEPLAVTCKSGEVAEVTLELLDGYLGRGRIVDQRTGEPIAQAAVQLFVRGDLMPVSRWGLPIPVRPDGSFEMAGFLSGENFIRALAEGYSSTLVSRETRAGSVLEWGEIALSPTQDFTLHLTPAERASGASASAWGSSEIPRRPFSPDGSLTFPAVSAGGYGVVITEADETTTQVEVNLVPGGDWTLHTRIAGENRLSVRVVSGGRDAMSQVDWVRVAFDSRQGNRTTRTKSAEGLTVVEFEGIDAPEVSLQLFREQELVATAGGAFQSGHLDLEVPLDGRDFLIRVVNPEGAPVSGVHVTIDDPHAPSFYLVGGTNTRGECRLKGVPEGDVLVGLQHGTCGIHLGIPVDASGESAELVLDGSARIELLLLDREASLGGITCALLDDRGAAIFTGFLTDDQGRVAIGNLAADDYSLRATRADCWPAEFTASAGPEAPLQLVQIRRLGDLALQVLTAEGRPVAGVSVQLRSLEFEADVAAWIREGRVPPAELATDVLGQVRVARLPRGPYRWSVQGLDGELQEGTLEVLPAQSTSARLTLR